MLKSKVILVLALASLACLFPLKPPAEAAGETPAEQTPSGLLQTLSFKRAAVTSRNERISYFKLHITNGVVRSFGMGPGCSAYLDNTSSWNADLEASSCYDYDFDREYFKDFLVIEKNPRGRLKFKMTITAINDGKNVYTEIRSVPSKYIVVRPFAKALNPPAVDDIFNSPAKISTGRYHTTGEFYAVSMNDFGLDKNERVAAFMLRITNSNYSHVPYAPTGWHFKVWNNYSDYPSYYPEFFGCALDDKSYLDMDFFKDFIVIERHKTEYKPGFEMELITKTGDEYKMYVLRNAPLSDERKEEFSKYMENISTHSPLYEYYNKLQPVAVVKEDIMVIKKYKTVSVPPE